MKINDKKGLIKYLKEFVTTERFETINRVLSKRTRYLTVVLEDLYQPHNASAVLRSCDGFGIQDVHISENRSEFRPTKRVTIGSDRWIAQHNYQAEGQKNTQRCYRKLKTQGLKLLATTPQEKERGLNQMTLDKKTALIFGAELNGLTDYAFEEADGYAQIRMQGFSESFNISVSAALCLYDLSTRMRNE